MRSIVLLVCVLGIVLAQEGTAPPPPPYGCANGAVPDCSTCPKSPCGNGGRNFVKSGCLYIFLNQMRNDFSAIKF